MVSNSVLQNHLIKESSLSKMAKEAVNMYMYIRTYACVRHIGVQMHILSFRHLFFLTYSLVVLCGWPRSSPTASPYSQLCSFVSLPPPLSLSLSPSLSLSLPPSLYLTTISSLHISVVAVSFSVPWLYAHFQVTNSPAAAPGTCKVTVVTGSFLLPFQSKIDCHLDSVVSKSGAVFKK